MKKSRNLAKYHRSKKNASPVKISGMKKPAGNRANAPPNTYQGLTSNPTIPVLDVLKTERPDTPPIDFSYAGDILKNKKIEPTNKKIGFLGLNNKSIVKNLCHSRHSIIIWNETPLEFSDFVENFKDNITVAATPADVFEGAEIIFSCASDPDTAKQVFFGNWSVLRELFQRDEEKKGYVEMTSMDPKISQTIGYGIRTIGGRYLEAALCGSRIDANEGTLFIIAAGDESLYNDSKSSLNSFSRSQKFLGPEVGTAFSLGIVHNMLAATVCASLAEALALVYRMGLKAEDFLDIIKNSFINPEYILDKATSVLNKRVQNQFHIGLLLGNRFSHPTPVFATVKEKLKNKNNLCNLKNM